VLNKINFPFYRILLFVWIVILYFCSLLYGCEIGENQNLKEYNGWGFSVIVPTNMHVTKRFPVHDFALHCFKKRKKDGKCLLQIFSGTHPSYGYNFPDKFEKKDLRINGLLAEKTYWIEEKLYYADYLICFPEGSYPEFAHCWYYGLNEHDKLIAEKIILSIKVHK